MYCIYCIYCILYVLYTVCTVYTACTVCMYCTEYQLQYPVGITDLKCTAHLSHTHINMDIFLCNANITIAGTGRSYCMAHVRGLTQQPCACSCTYYWSCDVMHSVGCVLCALDHFSAVQMLYNCGFVHSWTIFVHSCTIFNKWMKIIVPGIKHWERVWCVIWTECVSHRARISSVLLMCTAQRRTETYAYTYWHMHPYFHVIHCHLIPVHGRLVLSPSWLLSLSASMPCTLSKWSQSSDKEFRHLSSVGPQTCAVVNAKTLAWRCIRTKEGWFVLHCTI